VIHVAHMGEMKNAYNILVEKPEGKSQHGKSRHRWDNNIRMDFREIEWQGINWIHVAQDRDWW